MIEIKEFKVKLKGDLTEIINILKECLAAYGEDQEIVVNSMSPSAPQTRRGFLNNFLLRPIEKITGSALGAQGSMLNFEKITVSVPAQIIYSQYLHFLNKMLKAGKKGANNVSEELISSRVVLVCEFLKRIAAHAIANDQVTFDGDEYIKLMKIFSQKIGAKDWFDKRIDFLELLNGKHQKWILDLEKVVWFIKKLKNPEYTFQNLRIHLTGVQNKKILPQLVAKLTKKHITKANLDPRWLWGELIKAENVLLDRIRDEFSDYEPLTDDELKKIMGKNREAEGGYIYTRYHMLKLNAIITRIIESLDTVSAGTGWVIFFADGVNIPEIQGMLNWYDQKCNNELHIENAKELFSKNVRLALAKMRSLSCYGESTTLLKGLQGLSELNNPNLKVALQEYLVSAVNSINPIINELISAASDCPVTEQFINGAAIAAITGGGNNNKLLETQKNKVHSGLLIEEIDDDPNSLVANNDLNDNNRQSSYAKVTNQMSKGVVTLTSLQLTKNALKSKPLFKNKIRDLNEFLKNFTRYQSQQPKPEIIVIMIKTGLMRVQDIVGTATSKMMRKFYRSWLKENIAHISQLFHAFDELVSIHKIKNTGSKPDVQFFAYKKFMIEVDRLYSKYFPKATIFVQMSKDLDSSGMSLPDFFGKGKEEDEQGTIFDLNFAPNLDEDADGVEMAQINSNASIVNDDKIVQLVPEDKRPQNEQKKTCCLFS